ncbi:Carbamoyl-phosphate synthase large chain [Bienertia sinuspersici]
MKVLGKVHVNKTSEECSPGSNFEIEEEDIKGSNGDLNRLLQIKSASEIEEEEEMKGNEIVDVNNTEEGKESSSSTNEPESVKINNNMPISPQVEKALGALDKMIYVVKENRRKGNICSRSGPRVEGDEAKLSTTGKHVEWVDEEGTSMEDVDRATAHVSKYGVPDELRSEKSTSDEMSPNQNLAIAGNSPVAASPTNVEVDMNGIHDNNKKTGQQKKWRLCCFHLASGRLMS